MANSAEVIAERLYAAGCRAAFGIPGGEVLTLVNALGERGIEFVLAKHENAAGFMAEGTFHAGGAPALLVATLGPGVANAVNVVANAWQDRVPMIFLTGCVDLADAHSYTHQVFDHGALLAPVTKATFTVLPDTADVVLDKALTIACEGQPGPVHIDLPIGIADMPHRTPLPIAPQPYRGQPGARDLLQACEWLEQAKKPLLMVGLDVLSQGAESSVNELARRFGIPTITTYKAKGTLAETHSLALGGAGLSPKADAILLPLARSSDLLILAGYDPIEMRSPWCEPFSPEQRIVEFNSVTSSHGMHRANLQFVGDIAAGLQALSDSCNARSVWTDNAAQTARDQLQQAFSAGESWGPGKIIAVAREVMPVATVATVDSGAHRILLSQMWTCTAPRTLLQSTGLCTMGCALPLAIGYKRSAPDRPVIAFTGDAGLEMVLGELATLRDCRQPVIVLVFVDESLALIELKQRHVGHANAGVDFTGTNFVGVAAAFDMHAAWIDGAEQLRSELHDALTRSRSTLLACRIPRMSYDGTF
ncbi:MAG: thiamine pyrophosphate-binding protein [Gammaproteobacteria bacterium]|nr:thiamine pyrophosphate-binding protein [Gammaproteobacteria bacterium]